MKTTSNYLIILAALLLAACAPSPAMIATLTMLPGTPTPRPPTARPTRTTYPTNTLAPVPGRTSTSTPIPAADCPPFSLDTNAPADASMLPGMHFDLMKLPKAYDLHESGTVASTADTWVWVKWQGQDLFWIQRTVCKDATGKAFGEIVNSLALPPLDRKQGEASTMKCFNGASPLPLTIAYGIFDPTQPASAQEDGIVGWKLRILSAWQIQENFTPLDTQNLTCVVAGP